MINFYDGQVIPEAEASVDVVAFFSVLHHAARATPPLLRDRALLSDTLLKPTKPSAWFSSSLSSGC